MKPAYYNECDRLKAEVLRKAIRDGAIAPGDVDERSITDVEPADLVGYGQCHFFAGGGFWSLAFRQAGVRDDEPWWSGSCPCPGFSTAGKGGGFSDPRHLWPAWARLIRKCRPPVIFGEQAAAAIGFGWSDLVQADLEAEAYAYGMAVLGAHSVGAPHIRQRLYFCADADGGIARNGGVQRSGELRLFSQDRGIGVCADTEMSERGRSKRTPYERRGLAKVGGSGAACECADAEGFGRGKGWPEPAGQQGRLDDAELGCALGYDDALSPRPQGHGWDEREWRGPGWLTPEQARSVAEAGATRGYWADCDWWYGSDGKYRPIGPGLQPLAHGSPARVGRLRLYGDAICVPLAAEFVAAYREERGA